MKEFAYLFERFPSLTQTFCYREVAELRRQGAGAPVFSIRKPREIPKDCPAPLAESVHYLPPPESLGREMTSLRMIGRYPWQVIWRIRTWGRRPAKSRLLEAAWLGPRLRSLGIGHVHAHFAGIAARTAWWLREFYGITYSFTGHANDMFCESDSPVTLGELVDGAEFVVAVSDFTRDWLNRQLPGRETKIHRIYNGLDLSGFAAAPARAPVPEILAIGRCVEKKGFADLIDACAILKNQGVSFSCRIIGGGPLEDQLKARAAAAGLGERVMLTGPLPQETIREHLSRATVFALPCVTEADGGMDTLPTVIAEAMAARLPVVSTRLAAVPEMVVHGETGFLVDQRDPAALAAAISRLLASPDLCARLGAQGQAEATRKFAAAGTVAQLRALLEKAARRACE